jgi:hypothetical protein
VPRINYSDEFNGGAGAERFPKIALAKGERKRIVCPERPWMQWAHRLEAPKTENGQPLMKRREGRDGTVTLVWDLEWIGSPLCQGDNEVLKSKGTDPQNCQICAAAVNCKGIKPPVRRYAMNVVEYALQASGAPAVPFNVRVIVWAFTEKIYGRLLGYQKEWGNLQEHDLLLGPPEEPLYFQKYPIEITQSPLWRTSAETAAVLQQAWQAPGNRATDEQLRDACGSLRLQYLPEDLQRVTTRWKMAENAGPMQPGGQWNGQAQPGLADGFAGILQTQSAAGFQGQMHPLEAAAASQMPFGAPSQAAAPVPSQPGAGGFGAAPQQAAPAQPGFGDPFAPAAPAAPAQQPGPGAAPQQADPGGFGDPFAQTTQPRQPMAAPAPAVQPGGFSEFMPELTSNPAAVAQQPDPAFGAVPAAPAATQPSFAPPAPAVPPAGQAPSFEDLMNASGAQSGPQQ